MQASLELTATSAVLPARDFPGAVLTNSRLSELIAEFARSSEREIAPCDPDFPATRVGVFERGVLDAACTTRDMAVAAARRALRASGAAPADVVCTVVSTVTPDRVFPAIATTVQAELDLAEDGQTLDVAAGCNGFLVALDVAARRLADAPEGAVALVVAAESLMRIVDAGDRSTASIFGDGAGAVVLRRGQVARLGRVHLRTLGESGPRIALGESDHGTPRIIARGRDLTVELDRISQRRIDLDGRRVFRDMVRTLPDFVRTVLDTERVRLDEVDRFLMHQANARMTEAITGPALYSGGRRCASPSGMWTRSGTCSPDQPT